MLLAWLGRCWARIRRWWWDVRCGLGFHQMRWVRWPVNGLWHGRCEWCGAKKGVPD